MMLEARKCFWKIVLLVLLAAVLVADAQSGLPCNSTGPTCVNEGDCSEKPDGDYQFCENCTSFVRCENGSGTVMNITVPRTPYWDDNCKFALDVSSTCHQCYVPCYDILEPPSDNETVPTCPKTGATCVDSVLFCNNVQNTVTKLFQFCGNCRSYVNCSVFGSPLLSSCPSGTVWDDFNKSCEAVSTTCKECFEQCGELSTTTTSTTTVAPPLSTTVTTRAPPRLPCSSTGPTCLTANNCSQRADGDYQFCGNCTSYITCQNGLTTFVHLTNARTPFWDDNSKTESEISTTCHQCYLPCYPIMEPPPTGPELICEKSGPTCISGITFCNTILNAQRFQNCANCRSYVNCGGLGNAHSIVSCPNNTIWDDDSKQCQNISSTCVECFRQCEEAISVATDQSSSSITTASILSSTPETIPTSYLYTASSSTFSAAPDTSSTTASSTTTGSAAITRPMQNVYQCTSIMAVFLLFSCRLFAAVD